jgi:large subunit ribosomal protein L21
MFAVIKTGGKQYRIKVGEILAIEKLDTEKGKKVIFNQVLLIEDNENTLIGMPVVERAQVIGEVVGNFKDKKVIVFKKKRRKQYQKKIGHRQELTQVRIEKIIPDAGAAKQRRPTEEKVEPKEAPKKPKAKAVKKEPAAKGEKLKGKKPEEKTKMSVKKIELKKTQVKRPKTAAPKKKPSVEKPVKKKTSAKTKKSSSKKEK